MQTNTLKLCLEFGVTFGKLMFQTKMLLEIKLPTQIAVGSETMPLQLIASSASYILLTWSEMLEHLTLN